MRSEKGLEAILKHLTVAEGLKLLLGLFQKARGGGGRPKLHLAFTFR